MFLRGLRYAKHTHPKKSWEWRKNRYFRSFNLDKPNYKWVFGDKKTGAYLTLFGWFDIERHILVKGKSSPDDPNLREYWDIRDEKKVKNLKNKSRQKLAKIQNNVCSVCGESLYNREELHTHHKIPRSQGGKDTSRNLELIHLYCHQKIHGNSLCR